MEKIYYIENTVDEWHTKISGYFATLDKAKEGLKECCNWFRPQGTGSIYEVELGLGHQPKLVYQNY